MAAALGGFDMDDRTRGPATADTEIAPGELGHPRGTLAIVIVFAVLFALGWLAMYFVRFLGRGAPHA
jgi:hypothetical protein